MGLVTQTITFTTGLIPSAADWTNQFSTLYNLVNGQLDSANVDKTSSDGIMVLDTAQTRTAALTMTAGLTLTATLTLTGTYATPIVIGAYYLWHDATNDVLRVKSSAPASETDGRVLMEG
ncbi:MAG: hypothetical protein ABIG63_12615 [Chloroflexota bacterium]